MSSDWRPLLNNYLTDFEARTTTALENINRLLLQSGKTIDDRIKDYFMKSVRNRLEQTLDFFDIQTASLVHENVEKTTKIETKVKDCSKIDNMQMDSDSNDTIEIIENKIKLETIDLVPTSSSSTSEAEIETESAPIQPITYKRVNYRPSLDSCISDQRSTCSPSTSNQPMLSPIDTPDSTPRSTPDFNIKKEPDDMEFATPNFDCDECVVKMEDVPTDPAEMCKSPAPRQRRFDRSTSLNTEAQALKRQQSIEAQQEAFKRMKTVEECQVREPSPMLADKPMVAFACFYCHSQPSFFVNTYAEIYDHWKHSHGAIPFRFFVVGMASCFYCGKIDVFPNLQGHHKHNHHSEIFVVVDRQNRSKCGLCQRIFSASEMVVHFKSQHDPCLLVGINSPVCFTQHELDQLLTMNSCLDEPKQTGYMCGHCNVLKKTIEIPFMEHIEQDKFQYKCTVCPVVGKSIQETARHEETAHKLTNMATKHANGLLLRLERYYLRTRIIFNNGLVLFKHNVLNTTFDDRKDFWKLKERLAKEKYIECTTKVDEKLPTKLSFANKNELFRQRTYRNNLCIRGISTINSDEILRKIFAKICSAMEMDESDEIESIFQRAAKDIIVKFKNYDLKKLILKQWERMSTADKLEKLKPLKLIAPKIDLAKIDVQNDLTDFFRLLWQDAQDAKDKKRIHSFWISENGMSVKCTPKSPIDIIWSKADLIKCIRRMEAMKV